ncbi:MAG: EamA family transporter [Candidatus Woesebacteria bacterium]
MTWIFYALLSYATVAVANITDKLLVDRYIKDSSVIVLFTGSVAAIVGLLMIPFVGIPHYSLFQLIRVIAAGMLLQFYLIPYFQALEKDEPSRVIPLFQVIPIFSLILSWIFLHETLGVGQIVGFFFILFGGIFISVTKKGTFALRKTFWLMMLSSVLFAASTILFKGAVDENNVMQTIAVESLGIGVGTLLLFFLPGYAKTSVQFAKKMPVAGWGALATSEIFYVIYRFLLLIALSLGSVSIVSVLSGIQPVFVLLYSGVLSFIAPKFFHEDLSMKTLIQKGLAFVSMAIGLYFLYR